MNNIYYSYGLGAGGWLADCKAENSRREWAERHYYDVKGQREKLEKELYNYKNCKGNECRMIMAQMVSARNVYLSNTNRNLKEEIRHTSQLIEALKGNEYFSGQGLSGWMDCDDVRDEKDKWNDKAKEEEILCAKFQTELDTIIAMNNATILEGEKINNELEGENAILEAKRDRLYIEAEQLETEYNKWKEEQLKKPNVKVIEHEDNLNSTVIPEKDNKDKTGLYIGILVGVGILYYIMKSD